MHVSFAILFAAVGAGCFFLLVRDDKVASVVALRVAFFDLGLSLIIAAFAFTLSSPNAALICAALAHILLGAAVISMLFVIYPVGLKRTVRRRKVSIAAVESLEHAEQQTDT